MTDCICVNTLSELATISIPSGTQVAMVNQFNSSSAVSGALYMLVLAKPNHPLSIQVQDGTGAPWWTIHPDYLSLEAAGAPPTWASNNDCAPAMQNVLRYFAATGRATLNLWERDYILNSLSSSSALGLTIPANSGFAIIGRGQSVSRLVVPSPTNTQGVLAIVYPDTTPQCLLRDFSVIASAVGATSPANCGTAILLNADTGGALLPKSQYSVIAERIHIGPEPDSSGNGYGYFNTGLDLTGMPRPLVSETTICGCSGPITDDYTDTSPRYAAQTHLVLDECYSPQVIATRFWNATRGVSYDCSSTKSNPQGFVFSGCNMIGVRTGIYIRHLPPPDPAGRVNDNLIQFRDFGLDVGNVGNWAFPDNTYFLEGDIPRATPACDMRFVASNFVTITGATFGTFCGTGDSQNCGLRVNIYIDADTQSNGASGGASFLIESGMFGDQSKYFALSAIQTTPSAKNIQIGASNQFNGQFTAAVVNDASGTAITVLGYPGGAVAANGAASLGSNPIPWPANYNLTHYMLPTVAPTAPNAGWVFFVDPTTGELVALASSGKTVILGTP